MNDVSHYLRPGTLQLPALPPLSLYVHLPWCIRKCPYCDFNSHERREGTDAAAQQARYVDALMADLEASLARLLGAPARSEGSAGSCWAGCGTCPVRAAPRCRCEPAPPPAVQHRRDPRAGSSEHPGNCTLQTSVFPCGRSRFC